MQDQQGQLRLQVGTDGERIHRSGPGHRPLAQIMVVSVAEQFIERTTPTANRLGDTVGEVLSRVASADIIGPRILMPRYVTHDAQYFVTATSA